MKRRIFTLHLYALAFLMSLAACRKIDRESFTPQSPSISFEQQEVRVGNDVDTIEIDVDANLPWRITTDAAWVSLIKANGNAGEKAKIAVQRNRVVEERTAEITAYITADAQSKLLLIQAAGDPLPDVTRHFYVKADGPATNDGLSWANATTLDVALENAVSGDVIHVAAGTYVPSKMIRGGTVAGDRTFEIAENVKLVGGYPATATTGAVANPAVNKSVLSGDGQFYHVVAITAPREADKKVSISGFTIEKGKAHTAATNLTINGVSVSKGHGGGVIVAGSEVEFDHVSISDNQSGTHAAGMHITGIAKVTLRNSSVKNNTGLAETSNGGGIWNDGSELYMYNCEITGNRTGGVAGGLYAINTGRVSYNYLFNVTIAENEVGSTGNTGRTGAGIYARERSKFVIVNSTIYGNKNNGTAFGAGITLYGVSTVDLVNSTVFGNSGGAGNASTVGGSGIYNNPAHSNVLNIYNSIVAGNIGSAKEVGGANSPKSSVIGTEVYSYTGDVVAGQSFDATSAFAPFSTYGGFAKTLPLTNLTSAAAKVGMSTLQLQILASNLALEDTYFIIDQNNRSRSGKTVMGAALPQ